jgi:hypothetical protein
LALQNLQNLQFFAAGIMSFAILRNLLLEREREREREELHPHRPIPGYLSLQHVKIGEKTRYS